MKKLCVIPAALALLAFAASAQDEKLALEKLAAQVKVMSLQSGVMGKTIKGAPYSGVEVNESTQMLADGTRIHNESQTQVFRDSEGRMRRETPNEITIWDPVANASYVLNPKTQTARKLPMGNFVYSVNKTGNGEVFTYSLRTSSSEPVHAELASSEAKMKAEIESRTRAGGGYTVAAPMVANGAVMKRGMRAEKGSTESLGKRAIEGVNSEGTRTVMTTEVGAIGNDRPIQSVTERWFSPELQTIMLTRSTDPRSGEEVFKLINVNRSEPAAYLFQVPAGYQTVDAK